MIKHRTFQQFINTTFGTTSALLVKDDNASSPTGIRPWTQTDTDALAKWLASQLPTPSSTTKKNPSLPDDTTGLCLNPRQAAERAGVGIKTIRGWIKRRNRPLPHIRDGRRVIIPISTFTNWLEEESTGRKQQ